MKPATGNKPAPGVRKVSIQQPLDGHSFSMPAVPGLREGEVVEVEVLTPRTLLIPASMPTAASTEASATIPPAEPAPTSPIAAAEDAAEPAPSSETTSPTEAAETVPTMEMATDTSADKSASPAPTDTAETIPNLDPATDPTRTRAWFAACGMLLDDDTEVVATDPCEGRRALLGVRRGLVAQLRETWGPATRFTTPLLFEPAAARRCVWLLRRGGLTFVKVYDRTLELAEVLPTDADADLSYLMQRLAGCFPLKEYTLRVAGRDAKTVRRLLGRHFKHTRLEEGL